jgi:ketosteroid isomerase-like protein
MIIKAQAEKFAAEWIEAWNGHNLDRILEHYAGDLEMTSPYILSVSNEPTGTLKGKEAVRAYWAKALDRVPDLHFELLEVMAGIDSLVICYRGVFGKRAAEWMLFDDRRRVIRSVAHYD